MEDDGSSGDIMYPVHVEVCMTRLAKSSQDTIRNLVHRHLLEGYDRIIMPSTLSGWETCPTLRDNVEKIVVAESSCSHQTLPLSRCIFQIHPYIPAEGSSYEYSSSDPSNSTESVNAALVFDLPRLEFEGLWDSLIYEDDVKSKLLNYIYATIGMSDAGVDYNLVSWNRVVLLHGPPGTGKTSLCRALAQKLSVRLGDRYAHSRLLEINSHSLFSRWFSESGKLVQNLFAGVANMIDEEEEQFVVLLIDEVESLTAARAGAMAGTEPSDALRVVNALLTQLDKLKHRKNVLVLTTSNLPGAIDSAFVDRADIVQYIGFPPAEAVYEILRSCVRELMQKGLVVEMQVPAAELARIYKRTSTFSDNNGVEGLQSLALSDDKAAWARMDPAERVRIAGLRLFRLSEKCYGMSGRILRRLPVLAYARYIGVSTLLASNVPRGREKGRVKENGVQRSVPSSTLTQVEVWLDAMEKVVDDEIASRKTFDTLKS